ncbi:MAG: hypothetical protein Q9165_008455 [Trypethelium subeluteriae]
MDHDSDALRRTSSHNSVVSSRRSSAIRVKPRKNGSSASLQPSSAEGDGSLTSFPSLSPSPETSPSATRQNVTGYLSPTSSPRPAVTSEQEQWDRHRRSTQSLVGSLVGTPSRKPSRAALFDDTPKDSSDVPGNLHHAEDDKLRQLIAKNGSINIVRQLADDLAQRDAQMTALRRRAEERERLLRKMLRECEVSNLDIEKRLRELERRGTANHTDQSQNRTDHQGAHNGSQDIGLQAHASMNERMNLAMHDSVTSDVNIEAAEEADDLGAPGDQEATIRAKKQTEQFRGNSQSRNPTPSTTREQNKGWRGYLWPGTMGSEYSSRRGSVNSNTDQDSRPPTRSRASTLTQTKRTVLNGGLFEPPSPGLLRTVSSTAVFSRNSSEPENGISTRRSSTSVANWATKIFAGTSHSKNDKASTIRGRTTANGDQAERSASRTSVNTSKSANRSTGPKVVTTRSSTIRGSLAPSRTFRVGSPENKRITTAALGPVSPSSLDNTTNLGPVEMDTILPEESRPPTLAQLHYNMSDGGEYLTDRFGFIYDHRRKKRQAEAAAALQKDKRNSGFESLGSARDVLTAADEDEAVVSPDESSPRPDTPASNPEESGTKTAKRWQDYLKLASFPTELLAHTPVPAPITTVDGADAEEDPTLAGASKVTIEKRGSMPVLSVNPEPSETRVVSGNAEFAAPAGSSGTATPVDTLSTLTKQSDPVKSLLQQLTEVHDSLQRDKTVRWNDFLRKVRAERRLEVEAAASTSTDGRPLTLSMPEAALADGEVIGVAGLGNKGKVGRAKWKEFKALVLGGIPVAYRAKIWAECAGASAARVPGYYEDLVTAGADDDAGGGGGGVVGQIGMDITRTLTDNIYFRRGPGVHRLNEVLVAYARRNPEVGYCQGMNLITACLLLIMPMAEDAFWLLASMIENILPRGYYDDSLLTSRADQHVLRQYVAELLPKLSGHLDELGIELEALSFQWFLSVFTDCLSAEALFRVWDVVLCINDGSTFLFQVALALLKLNEGALLECDSPAGVYHYINHQMTNHAISIDGLIQASEALKKDVRREEVQERRERAVEKELDFIRQREEAVNEAVRERKRGKQRADEREAISDGVANVDSGASEDLEVPIRSSRSSSVAPEEAEEVGIGMTWRQPMPIDEEAEWRA